ncbi:MAG: WG repeat-containing protein [Oscillospiraceae bacterium]|nr:WG repeat-containing protein [Oscillospiraceae bacterium]
MKKTSLIPIILAAAILLCACGAGNSSTTIGSAAEKTDLPSADLHAASLQASGSYGSIYPYTGRALYSLPDASGQGFVTGYVYGMFDYLGNRVSDAVYSGIQRLSYYSTSNFSELPLPLWVLESQSETGFKYALAAADGSFVTAPIYDSIYGIGCGAVAVIGTGASAHFAVYDTLGNILYTESSAGLSGRVTERTAFCINSSADRIIFELSDGYDLFDLHGNHCSGPWYYVGEFNDGAAPAALGPGQYGMIDPDGQLLISMSYDYVSEFLNGHALLEADGYYRVIDREMNILFGLKADYASLNDYGISCSHDAAWHFYDFNGTELLNDRTYSWTGLYGTRFFTRSTDAGVAVINVTNQFETVLSGIHSVSPFYTMLGTAPVPYLQASKTDNNGKVIASYLLDQQLGTVYSFSGDCYWDAVQDKASGEWYLVQYVNGEGLLYTIDLVPLCPFSYSGTIYDGMVFYTDGNSFTARDFYGNQIFQTDLF